MARAPKEDEAPASPKRAASCLIAMVPIQTDKGLARPGEAVELSAADAKLAIAHHMAIEQPAAD